MNKTNFLEYELQFEQKEEEKDQVYDDYRLSNATHLTFSTHFTPFI